MTLREPDVAIAGKAVGAKPAAFVAGPIDIWDHCSVRCALCH